MKRGITLITMGQGNVKALKKTMDSFNGRCNEIVYGDMLVFDDDREVLKSYYKEYNLKVVELPFNYIFQNGFSSVLNLLAKEATNDLVIYMNTSEIIQTNYGITDIVDNFPDCNCFYFDHATDPHRWYRMYDKNMFEWSGRIHEEIVGDHRPYHKPIFTMADLDKDMGNPFKAKVFNDIKELTYFNQYIRIVDNPELLGATNFGWMGFAKDSYDSMKERLTNKGKRYEAFMNDDFTMYMEDVLNNPEFEKERFESNITIEFQGQKKYLL